jgi:hypothetical protein
VGPLRRRRGRGDDDPSRDERPSSAATADPQEPPDDSHDPHDEAEARLAVPLVAIPLAMNGIFPHMMYVFAVLDPVSGLVTWRILSKS